MQVAKWGNSLAVRLPARLVKDLGLKEGDEVEIRRAPDGALEVSARRDQQVDDAFAKVAAMRGKFPAGYTFDRSEANRRETGDGD